ncbi:hypothetical protein MKQ70_26880 [Chitinophaga sedimenti]|uniref:delta-60 repeat domain-containing protein n=1 Tax=Chitinophaga sedimenti TaxID=2033606 RepID=UPI002002EB97|nr:delta-60 repeat domain-containing protein [Chitinophaga sedimenti]MCK7558426.1 hypothetical protein [Chitinophaga sedimenti]
MKRLLYLLPMAFAVLVLACAKESGDDAPEEPTGPGTGPSTPVVHPTWQASAWDVGYQKSGKMVVLGGLTKSGGPFSKPTRVYRLVGVDSIDAAFDTTTLAKVFVSGVLPSELTVQTDDKILLDGEFTVDGKKTELIRLLPDGKLDMDFINNVRLLFTSTVKDYQLTPAGQIYVLGQRDYEFKRLNPDGTEDKSFVYRERAGSWSPSSVSLLPDGKLLFVQNETVTRINSDGSRDATFKYNYKRQAAANTTDYTTLAFAFVQKDGKFILTGKYARFTDNADATKVYDYLNVARFNADGTFDPTFQKSSSTDGTAAVYLMSDDTFWRKEAKVMYTNNWQEVVRQHDKDGKVLGEYTVKGLVDKVIGVKNGKVLIAGNFFDDYDSFELLFDKYAADVTPLKEVTLK